MRRLCDNCLVDFKKCCALHKDKAQENKLDKMTPQEICESMYEPKNENA